MAEESKINPTTGNLDKIGKSPSDIVSDDARYLQDAPSDGLLYGRKDGVWKEITLMPPVYDWWDPTGGLPPAPADGDRYASDGTGSGWTDGYIYEWDDTAGVWVESEPDDGWMFWMIAELLFYVFFSGGWMEVGSRSFLKLDQTIPQYVENGAPQFDEGITIKADKRVYLDGI